MKQIIYGIINLFLIILFVILLLVIGENGLRRMEVNENTSNAISATMSSVIKGEGDAEYGDEEWTAEFIEELLIQASDNESLLIDINEMDMEMGILSASVKEEFVYANGNKASKSGSRTAIIDRQNEEQKQMYSVAFYCDIYENGEIVSVPFCKYTIAEGEKCIYPSFPELENYKFSYARFEEGGPVTTISEGDLIFILDKNGKTMNISQNIEIHGVYKNV